MGTIFPSGYNNKWLIQLAKPISPINSIDLVEQDIGQTDDIQEKTHWGKAGSGILFYCSTDNSILLLRRSGDVENPYTWGIAGGAVGEEGYFSNDNKAPSFSNGTLRQNAEKEVIEEMGFMPPTIGSKGKTEFKDGSFTYTTFVEEIDYKNKQRTLNSIELNWENVDAEWFKLNDLPDNVHPGVLYTISRL